MRYEIRRPLIGKTVEIKYDGHSYFGHLDSDILSAIEWLKIEIKYKNTDEKTTLLLMDIYTKIDEAFQGIQR